MIERQIFLYFNAVNEVIEGGHWAEVVLERSRREMLCPSATVSSVILLYLIKYWLMKSTHWPLISFKWHSLANLKKQKPCVVLPLLSRMNIEQVVGTTSKLFQSRLVICLLQFWIFSFSGNMHQKQKVLSLQRLSQDLGFGFFVQNLFYVFFLHVLHWRADPACYMEDHSSVLPAWLPWWPKVFSWHRAWWGTFISPADLEKLSGLTLLSFIGEKQGRNYRL